MHPPPGVSSSTHTHRSRPLVRLQKPPFRPDFCIYTQQSCVSVDVGLCSDPAWNSGFVLVSGVCKTLVPPVGSSDSPHRWCPRVSEGRRAVVTIVDNDQGPPRGRPRIVRRGGPKGGYTKRGRESAGGGCRREGQGERPYGREDPGPRPRDSHNPRLNSRPLLPRRQSRRDQDSSPEDM